MGVWEIRNAAGDVIFRYIRQKYALSLGIKVGPKFVSSQMNNLYG